MRKRAFASLVLACLLSALFLGGGCQVPTGEEATGPAVGAPQQSADAALPSAVPDAQVDAPPAQETPAQTPVQTEQPESAAGPAITWLDAAAADDPVAMDGIAVAKAVFSAERLTAMLSAVAGDDAVLCRNYTRSAQEWEALLHQLENSEYPNLMAPDAVRMAEEGMASAPKAPEYESLSVSELADAGRVSLDVVESDGSVAYVTLEIGGNSFAYFRSEVQLVTGQDMCEQNLLLCATEAEREQLNWLMPRTPDIAQADALALAEGLVQKLDVPLELFYSEPCSIVTDYATRSDGWKFIFTRRSGTYPAQFWDGQWCYVNPEAPPVAGGPWEQEVCTVVVDVDGVCVFNWRGAAEATGTTAHDGLLAQADMRPLIEAELTDIYRSHTKQGDVYLDICITEMQAGIALLGGDGGAATGEYVPAWYVSYRYKWSDEADAEENWSPDMIVFDMTDGRYIEPRITEEKLRQIRAAG